ncbi:MAG: DedA family protein [Chitinispirillaceae bacterium]|nr:DedA family protein [Chitinispirillaceae bacterium]
MGVTEFLAGYITAFIDTTGYASVFVLMTMESMVFPVPSEAVMPFAGFLIAEGRFTFTMVIVFSTGGSIAGSLLSYWIGLYGGKPFIARFGRFFLLNHDDLAATERFFQKRGDITILICRFIPVVRHLVSIPAGTGRMNIIKFSLYTVIGAGLWNAFLTACGFHLRKNWETVMAYSRIVDIIVLILLACGLVYFIVKHVKRPAGSRPHDA